MSLPFAPRLLFSYLALLLCVQVSSGLELTPSRRMIIVTQVLFLFGIHFVPYCSADVLSDRYIIHMHRHEICTSTSTHKHTHPDTYSHMHTYICTHTYTHKNKYMHMHVCTHKHIRMHMNIQMYMHTVLEIKIRNWLAIL